VAHLTGTAQGAAGAEAQLVITSMSVDGLTATADFVTCLSANSATPGPVAASLPLAVHGNVQSITVRAKSNTIDLTTTGD